MARLVKQDWLEEGFRLLSEFAQDRLRIAYLCERLKVTRGSFYHHFKSIDDYISTLLEEWAKRNTNELIQQSRQAQAPDEKMAILNQMIFTTDQSIEAAIRSWSFYHPVVKSHLEQVDQKRLAFLIDVFQAMGLSLNDAKLQAELEYGTLIGLQQLFPNISTQRLNTLYEFHLKRLKKE